VARSIADLCGLPVDAVAIALRALRRVWSIKARLRWLWRRYQRAEFMLVVLRYWRDLADDRRKAAWNMA